MKLSELFENQEQKIQDAMLAWMDDLQQSGASLSTATSLAMKVYKQAGRGNMSAEAAAEKGAKQAISLANKEKAKREIRAKAKLDALQTRAQNKTSSKEQPPTSQSRVQRTITRPHSSDPDRTRTDVLGRNLKADRYYNQLNKSQRGRSILKKVSQKLGLPPQSDEVIDYIADTMPTVTQNLDKLISNPADIGGALNPRNRRNNRT